MDTKYENLILTLSKWIFFGALIGVIIGSTTALLLTTNDKLGDFRKENIWLIGFLPIAGIFIGYLYMIFGKSFGNDSAKGNNLVIEGVELFDGKGIEYFFVACLISYIFSGHHGLWPSQTIYEPKSRLYNLTNGESNSSIEKKQKS